MFSSEKPNSLLRKGVTNCLLKKPHKINLKNLLQKQKKISQAVYLLF
jgi:hypothetical protein